MLSRFCEINNFDDLLFFAQNANRVYIYGMGKYGQALYSFLDCKKSKPDGYIVTHKSFVKGLEYDVKTINEIDNILTENDAIVIGVGANLRDEVVRNIPERIKAKIGIIREEIFHEIIYEEYKENVKSLTQERPPFPYTGKDSFRNILVIRLDRMGDLIWTSAFLRELRYNFHDANITVVVSKGNISLLDGCPYIDDVIGYSYSSFEENGGVSWEEELQRAKEFAESNLQQKSYDVVFLPRGLEPDSARANVFLAVYSSATVRIANYFTINNKVEKWFDLLMKNLFSLVIGHDVPKHETVKMLDMLTAIGCAVDKDVTEVWKSPKNSDNVSISKELKYIQKKYSMLVAVGLTTQDQQKNWDVQKFKEVFREMGQDFSVCFLLLGDKAAVEFADKAMVKSCCVDFTGKTGWNDIINIMEVCDMYFGLDTGLVHVAAALGKPVMELICHLPWGDDDMMYSMVHCGAWRTKSVAIYPSFAADERCAQAGQCISKQSHCINNIAVDKVVGILKQFLLYHKFEQRRLGRI